jgi:hypothetical protein
VTPPELFTAANESAWDAGFMLSQANVWIAVYEWETSTTMILLQTTPR